jgi:hypothetical protein
MLKRPTITDYQSAESEQLMKRLRPSGHGVDEVILHLHSENNNNNNNNLAFCPKQVGVGYLHSKNMTFLFCMNFNDQSCLCRPPILPPSLNLHGQWMIFLEQLLVHCHMDLM